MCDLGDAPEGPPPRSRGEETPQGEVSRPHVTQPASLSSRVSPVLPAGPQPGGGAPGPQPRGVQVRARGLRLPLCGPGPPAWPRGSPAPGGLVRTGLGLDPRPPARPSSLPVSLQPRGQPAGPTRRERLEPGASRTSGAELPSARGGDPTRGLSGPRQAESTGTETGAPRTQQGLPERSRRLGSTLTGAPTAALASRVDARCCHLCSEQPSERPACCRKPSLRRGAAGAGPHRRHPGPQGLSCGLHTWDRRAGPEPWGTPRRGEALPRAAVTHCVRGRRSQRDREGPCSGRVGVREPL